MCYYNHYPHYTGDFLKVTKLQSDKAMIQI